MAGIKMRLGFFASHRGSNLQAIVDACEARRIMATPAVLICNNRGAEALSRAERHGIPAYAINATTHPDAERRDGEIEATLRRHHVDLVVLAGYMKKLGPAV